MRHLKAARTLTGIVAACGIWFLALSTSAKAQGTQGQNGVCSSSTFCTAVIGTGAFIDASMFPASGRDFCGVLTYVLTPSNGILPSGGGVIDARGLPGTTGTSMTCMVSPWAGITVTSPSVVLLPAGTIVTAKSWLLPPNTHLIGEGDNISSGTTIQAKRSGFSGSNLISLKRVVCAHWLVRVVLSRI
jgi:hypothetical protein